MSKERDNIENLEQELEELRKKKKENLLKEISALEKELGVSSVQAKSDIRKTKENKKNSSNLITLFTVLLISLVGLSVASYRYPRPELLIKAVEEKTTTAQQEAISGNFPSENTTVTGNLDVTLTCTIIYIGGDKTTNPVLKVEIYSKNRTGRDLKNMSIYIEPAIPKFRTYFYGTTVVGSVFDRTVYYDINPTNKNERHKVSFYIRSHSPEAAVGTCYAKA